MIRIYSDGEQITYTAGDTFSLDISSADGFESGSQLKFQIAVNEKSDFLINKIFELKDGAFEIVITDDEKQNLQLGNYIYRITVISANGDIVTRKSGELTVKWGA